MANLTQTVLSDGAKLISEPERLRQNKAKASKAVGFLKWGNITKTPFFLCLCSGCFISSFDLIMRSSLLAAATIGTRERDLGRHAKQDGSLKRYASSTAIATGKSLFDHKPWQAWHFGRVGEARRRSTATWSYSLPTWLAWPRVANGKWKKWSE